MFPKRLERPEMLCAASSSMVEESDGGSKVFVGLMGKYNCLEVGLLLALICLENVLCCGWSVLSSALLCIKLNS